MGGGGGLSTKSAVTSKQYGWKWAQIKVDSLPFNLHSNFMISKPQHQNVTVPIILELTVFSYHEFGIILWNCEDDDEDDDAVLVYESYLFWWDRVLACLGTSPGG